MAEIIPMPSPEAEEGDSISEDWVARKFGLSYGPEFIYCHSTGAWFRFDGSIWRYQETPIAFHIIREIAIRASVVAKNKATLQKAAFCRGAEAFARADPVMSATAGDWNKDIFLLGTPGGTVDLRNGVLRDSNRRDRITKSTAITPDDHEDCPRWIKFLREATGRDDGLIRYLQQICGYALTGDISEQSLFFIHGPGGAGKGTFLKALQKILGDYSVVATMEALEAQKFSTHTTDLAMMAGARLVSASETEEGGSWNEKRIKSLTGGDQITARFMAKNNMTFTPQFTLLVIGNHKPALKTVDEAMRRRFNMIPFTIIPTNKDKHLDDKLQNEWPGILRWMINGCLDWQKNGFIRPAVVQLATAKYFEDQDLVNEWLRVSCDIDRTNDSLIERSSSLFTSWGKFAHQNGMSGGTTKTFKPMMERLGFDSHRDTWGIWFRHLRLRQDANAGDYDD